MEYKKILDIVKNYIDNETSTEVANMFCIDFMEEFYNAADALEKEVEQRIYELFDDINLVCDSYEPNIKIRENDKYCIDDILLRNKVLELYKKIVA